MNKFLQVKLFVKHLFVNFVSNNVCRILSIITLLPGSYLFFYLIQFLFLKDVSRNLKHDCDKAKDKDFY